MTGADGDRSRLRPLSSDDEDVESARVTPDSCVDLLVEWIHKVGAGRVQLERLSEFFAEQPDSVRTLVRPTVKRFLQRHADGAVRLEVEPGPPRCQYLVAVEETDDICVFAPMLGDLVRAQKDRLPVKYVPKVLVERITKHAPSIEEFVDRHGLFFDLTMGDDEDGRVVCNIAKSDTAVVQHDDVIPEVVTTLARAESLVQVELVDLKCVALAIRPGLLCMAAPPSTVLLFDTQTCPALVHDSGLSKLLSSSAVMTIVHDSASLASIFGTDIPRVFDVQAAHQLLTSTTDPAPLELVLKTYSSFVVSSGGDSLSAETWDERPVASAVIQHAQKQVEYLIDSFAELSDRLDPSVIEAVYSRASSTGRQVPTETPPAEEPPAQPNTEPQAPLPSELPSAAPLPSNLDDALRQFGDAFESDKHGISVSGSIAPLQAPVLTGVTCSVNLTITGSSEFSMVTCTLLQSSWQDPPPFSVTPALNRDSHQAPVGPSVDVVVSFRSSLPGCYRAALLMEFQSVSEGDGESEHSPGRIVIGRMFDNVNCVEPHRASSIAELGPQKPFQPRKRFTRFGRVERDTFDRDAIGSPPPMKTASSLAPYNVPAKFKLPDDFAAVPSIEGYAERFHQLLFAEEVKVRADQRNYDLSDAPLMPIDGSKGRYRVAVAGLAEKRPSVLVLDDVFLLFCDQTYRARVMAVEQDHIQIVTGETFRARCGSSPRADIRFVHNRKSFKLSHQGVDAFDPAIHGDLVFPSGDARIDDSKSSSDRQVDVDPKLNDEQRSAVQNLVEFDQRSRVPYVIFGPPGTGKTATLVEALRHIVRVHSDIHVLVCCPTNAAADLLVERLAPVMPPSSMLRVMARNRKQVETPSAVLPFASICEDGDGFASHSMEDITADNVRVVVATLSTAGTFVNLGVPRGFFKLIAVDEAGQATEPELMSVVGPLADKQTRLVLSGDPEQLGPIVMSKDAAAKGLGVSLLERLVRLPVYGPGSAFIQRLVRNYRSHPALLTVPSDLFYNSSLVACANKAVSYSFADWLHLPSPGTPVVFHGVEGADMREGTSPSWFNPHEVNVVLDYVELIQCSIPLSEIGIITPYLKQKAKISRALEAMGLRGVRVGSVEQFQGAELRAVIISTVRSSSKLVGNDLKFNLGFVANPKRFNVAITRAQALLVVIGNPRVLQSDKNWDALLQHCLRSGACKGVAPKRPATDVGESDDSGNDSGLKPAADKLEGENERNPSEVPIV